MVSIKKNETPLFAHVIVAKTRAEKSKGLLGRKHLPEDTCMLFFGAKWIHTFFMAFPIDIAFLDKNMSVVAIFYEVQPFRLLPPILSSSHTIETAAGVLKRLQISKNDKLDVEVAP